MRPKSFLSVSLLLALFTNQTPGIGQSLQIFTPHERLVKTGYPPPPDYVRTLKAAGLWDKYVEEWHQRPAGVEQPVQPAEAILAYDKVLVVLVDFPDATFDSRRDNLQYFTDLMFSDGKRPEGSAKEYLRENSYGQFTLDGAVVGIVRAPHPLAYYDHWNEEQRKWDQGWGPFPTNEQGLFADIIPLIDPRVDFREYDPDGNGLAEHIVMVYATANRKPQADGHLPWLNGAAWELWPNPLMTEDGTLVKYFITLDEGAGMGAHVHELGHNMLGLPDLYDTDYSSAGVGDWSTMSFGIYRNPPVHYDAWSKVKTGWVKPTVVTSNWTDVSVPRVEDHPVIYKVWRHGRPYNEYYLIENRRRVLGDRDMVGEGLLIWHCDDTQTNNTHEWYPGHTSKGHYWVALEQADGRFDLERNANHGDAGDPFPGTTNNRVFDFQTTPSSANYGMLNTNVAVWAISDPGDTMWANIFVSLDGPSTPPKNLVVEAGYLSAKLRWQRNWESDVVGYNVYRSTMPGGGYMKLNSQPVSDSTVYHDKGLQTGQRYYYVVTAVDAQGYESPFSKEVTVLPISFDRNLLVVDETRFSGTALPEESAVDAFYANLLAGFQYDSWDVDTLGVPSLEVLGRYRTIFWHAEDYTNQRVPEVQAALERYLATGGNLILIGWKPVKAFSTSNYPIQFSGTDFVYRWLHIARVNTQVEADFVGAYGQQAYPDLRVDSAKVPTASWQGKMKYIEIFLPTDAEVIYRFDSAKNDTSFEGHPCAVRFMSAQGGRVVIAGFPLYFLQVEDARAFLTQALRDVSTSVATEKVATLPQGFTLHQNYPNPFNAETVIGYQISEVSSQKSPWVTLKIYDLLGREVRTLVEGSQSAGFHRVRWDGRDEHDVAVASGVYFYRLQVGEFSRVRKMVSVK